ncbi:conjugal transfer transcriptional regulator TraJ [Azohydromonas australica]|uniref:conjugal transfer transcriptional regulator TraJ n=1 Tax=Azohydromonas australica TaxID=364039 RepID=UPI0003F88722|nr:conjugal transfer transcriptional regulator TraJ [Azohydromonas australica]
MKDGRKKPRYQHLRVPVLPQEKVAIEALAKQAHRPVARYLREVGLGYKLHSAVDLEAVGRLAKVNGDLGRLGGLLKLWLAGDGRTARFTPAMVEVLLGRIAAQQEELARVMQEIVTARRGA